MVYEKEHLIGLRFITKTLRDGITYEITDGITSDNPQSITVEFEVNDERRKTTYRVMSVNELFKLGAWAIVED